MEGWRNAFALVNSFRWWKLPMLVTALAIAVFGSARARRVLLLLVVAVLINDGIVAERLKTWVGRPRPGAEAGERGNSFPSSHAMNCFAAATIAASFYGWAGATAFVQATAVAVGRVVEGVHYPSDVVAGAILGVLLALAEVTAARRLWRARRRWPGAATVLQWTPEKRWKVAGLALIATATLLRLIYIAAGRYALAADEAYYWNWSQHPALSYYSKGPGIALQIGATTALLGDHDFAVRIGPVLWSAAIGLLLWTETARRRGGRDALFVVLALSTIPLFAAGSVLATIDPPLLACWTAALVLYARAIESDETIRRSERWIALGAVLGAGFIAKFAILFIVPGFVIHAWRSGAARRGAGRGLALAIATFLPFVIPFIVWNHAHGWTTVRHLVERGGLDSSPRIRFDTPFELVGVQALIISPVLWVMLLHGAWKEFRIRGRSDPWTGALGWAVVPLLVFYLPLSFRSRVQPNWLAPLYLSAVPLAVSWFVRRHDAAPIPRRRRLVIAARGALALGAVMSLLVYRGDLLWKIGYDPPVRALAQRRLLGWRELAGHADRIRDRLPDPARAFVLGSSYQIASELAWYGDGHPRADTLAPLTGRSQYDYWSGIEGEPGADAVIVVHADKRPIAEEAAAAWFESWEDAGTFDVVFKGHLARRYALIVARGYRAGAHGAGVPPR